MQNFKNDWIDLFVSVNNNFIHFDAPSGLLFAWDYNLTVKVFMVLIDSEPFIDFDSWNYEESLTIDKSTVMDDILAYLNQDFSSSDQEEMFLNESFKETNVFWKKNDLN